MKIRTVEEDRLLSNPGSWWLWKEETRDSALDTIISGVGGSYQSSRNSTKNLRTKRRLRRGFLSLARFPSPSCLFIYIPLYCKGFCEFDREMFWNLRKESGYLYLSAKRSSAGNDWQYVLLHGDTRKLLKAVWIGTNWKLFWQYVSTSSWCHKSPSPVYCTSFLPLNIFAFLAHMY